MHEFTKTKVVQRPGTGPSPPPLIANAVLAAVTRRQSPSCWEGCGYGPLCTQST